VIAAICPSAAAARITVREAIQDSGIESSAAGQGRVESLFRFVQEKIRISRPLLLSLRNTFRRRGRLVRTLIPLALGGAIFISVLSVRASLFRTLEDMLISQGFDLQVQLTRPYQVERIEQLTAQIEGISVIEGWTVSEGVPVHADGTEGESLLVHAVPADTRLFAPTLAAGRWLEPNDEDAIVVSTGLLFDEPSLGLDEQITLRIDGKETTWRIVGLNERFQPPIAPSTLYVNRPRYWRLLGNSGRANTIRMITAEHDAAAHARIAAQIEERFQVAGIEIRSTRTATEDRDIFRERFNIITTILLIMAFLLATVGGLGLMGTMSINVLERTREIGVMRAIGASNFAVLQIFIAEGVVIGVLSWIGALILAQPMSRIMSYVIGLNFARLPLTYVFDWRAPLLWMLIIAIIAVLASIVPARNAAGIPVRETLAYE
jgi:putative ABC transport system permease protein